MKQNSDNVRAAIEKLREEGYSFLALFTKNSESTIGLGGERSNICCSLHTAIEAYKKGHANFGQEQVADMILDVISVVYSPEEIKRITKERISAIMEQRANLGDYDEDDL